MICRGYEIFDSGYSRRTVNENFDKDILIFLKYDGVFKQVEYKYGRLYCEGLFILGKVEIWY